jgi:hypothetical protein
MNLQLNCTCTSLPWFAAVSVAWITRGGIGESVSADKQNERWHTCKGNETYFVLETNPTKAQFLCTYVP